MTYNRIGLQKIMNLIKSFNSAQIIVTLCVFFSSWSTLSTHAEAPKEIVVSAAISLKDGFIEIGELYEERTGVKINFNFGASGVLQKQIESGAPVDVFASAGEKQMDELEAKKLIEEESRSDFARNTLVLVTPTDLKPNLSSFNELDSPK
ncbi:MAG: molybdate ABC transporter substrate-binding protein, partial [Thermodesulfobacteriota bacterium]